MLSFDVGLMLKYDLKLCIFCILLFFQIGIVVELFLDDPPILQFDFFLQFLKRLDPLIHISFTHISISLQRLEIIFLKSLIHLQQFSILFNPLISINSFSLIQYNFLQLISFLFYFIRIMKNVLINITTHSTVDLQLYQTIFSQNIFQDTFANHTQLSKTLVFLYQCFDQILGG